MTQSAHSLHTARCAYPRSLSRHAAAGEQMPDLAPRQLDANADFDIADWKVPSPFRVRGRGGDVLDTRHLEQAVYGLRWLLSHLVDDRLAAGGTLADFDPWQVAADRLATYPEPALAEVFGPYTPPAPSRPRPVAALFARVRAALMRLLPVGDQPVQLPIGARTPARPGELFRPGTADPSSWLPLRGATIQYSHDSPSWDGHPPMALTGRVREVRRAGGIPLLVISSSAGRNVIDPRWWRITVLRRPRPRLTIVPASRRVLDDTGERR